MRAATDLDLNNPPPGMQPAELLSHYEVATVQL
jgi:hypothetical protein